MRNGHKKGQDYGPHEIQMRQGVEREPAAFLGRGVAQCVCRGGMRNLVKYRGNQNECHGHDYIGKVGQR